MVFVWQKVLDRFVATLFLKSFKVRLANRITKGTIIRLEMFIVLGNQGSKFALRCGYLNPGSQILSLMPNDHSTLYGI